MVIELLGAGKVRPKASEVACQVMFPWASVASWGVPR